MAVKQFLPRGTDNRSLGSWTSPRRFVNWTLREGEGETNPGVTIGGVIWVKNVKVMQELEADVFIPLLFSLSLLYWNCAKFL